jgi:hypothetical protein
MKKLSVTISSVVPDYGPGYDDLVIEYQRLEKVYNKTSDKRQKGLILIQKNAIHDAMRKHPRYQK